MDKVVIHPFWIKIVSPLCGALLGVIWYQLNARIKSKADQITVEEMEKRLQQVETWKLDKGAFKQHNELLKEKFKNTNQRIDDMIRVNSHEHSSLNQGILKVEGAVDDIHCALVDIQKCLVKLANNQKC